MTRSAAGGRGLWQLANLDAVAPAVTYATFNGAPSTAFITMSNGNLTVTKNTTANSGSVRSTNALSTGKYYFEITNTIKSTGTAHALGIATAADTNLAVGTVVAPATATTIYSNGVDQSKALGTAASGNVYGFAIDLTGRLAWISRAGGNWNGDVAANPATGTGGVVIPAGSYAPAVFLSTNTTSLDSVTANFGASAFSGAVPSGFTSGWPA